MAQTAYSWDEIKKHNTPDSLWVVIDGNVYDVTKFKEEVSKKLEPYNELFILCLLNPL